MDGMDIEIQELKAQWKSWADKRCENLPRKYHAEYIEYAAQACVKDVQLLLNEDKRGSDGKVIIQ